jgi:cell division initiation protein
MKITPLDLTQKTFRRVLRGVDPHEVEAFLALVAAEVEALVRENQALRDTGHRMVEEIADLKSRERALQETMIAAQKVSEEIRETARKEAEITLSEAELQAEKIVQSAHQRYLRVVDDVAEVKRQRTQFEVGLRAMVESHLKLLEAFRDNPAESGVELLAPKKKAGDEKK